MKIVPVSNNYSNVEMRANKKTFISTELIQRVNQRMIETGGRSRERSPLEKFADIMLDKNVKEIPKELNEAKNEFDALSKDEQDRLL